MNLGRISILFKKELLQGPRGFIFIFAIILPIVLSFFLAVIFGNLTSDQPKLGVYDQDTSQLSILLQDSGAVTYKAYTSETDIKDAASTGAVDIGIVLPADFDTSLASEGKPVIQAYTWGESLAKNRAIISATVIDASRSMSGQDSQVSIDVVSLGDAQEIPWSVRVLPLIMLFAVFLGGVFIPSVSLIDEKSKRTMTALIVTPVSVTEVFVAKGLLGFILSLFVGVVVLAVNQALGTQPGLLVLTLALGAVMAVEIGMILGALLKDVSSLFAVWKSAAILLIGPAVVYMFPQIPAWIGRLFPTYYMLEPLMNITQAGAGWADIATNILILVGIDIVIFAAFLLVMKRSSQFNV